MYYDKNKLKNIVNDFAKITKSTVSVYDENFLLLMFSVDCAHSFCFKVKSKCFVQCGLCDMLARENLTTNDRYSYRCHAGLTEFYVTIRDNGKVLCYVMVGQILNKNKRFTEEELRNFAAKYGLAENELLEEMGKVTAIDDDWINAAQDMIEAVFEYAKKQNIIAYKEYSLFDEIVLFIQNNLNSILNIDVLCKKFFITKRQLYALFKENAETTVAQYIMRVRAEEAKKLILTTDMPLTNIAEIVGINDYNYFVKVFKNAVGCVPSALRKRTVL